MSDSHCSSSHCSSGPTGNLTFETTVRLHPAERNLKLPVSRRPRRLRAAGLGLPNARRKRVIHPAVWQHKRSSMNPGRTPYRSCHCFRRFPFRLFVPLPLARVGFFPLGSVPAGRLPALLKIRLPRINRNLIRVQVNGPPSFSRPFRQNHAPVIAPVFDRRHRLLCSLI